MNLINVEILFDLFLNILKWYNNCYIGDINKLIKILNWNIF
jgi:hypothetical protein